MMVRSTVVATIAVLIVSAPNAEAQTTTTVSTAGAPIVGTWEMPGSTTSFGQIFFAPSGLQTIDYFRIHLAGVWTGHSSDPSRTLNTAPLQVALNVFDMTPMFGCGQRPLTDLCPGASVGSFTAVDHRPYKLVADPAGNVWMEFNNFNFTPGPSRYYGFNLFWDLGVWVNFSVVDNSSYEDGYAFRDAHANLLAGGDAEFEVGYTVVVPEPGSVLLLATGLLGLVGVGWRRRRAA